jgi:hypothetical protein
VLFAAKRRRWDARRDARAMGCFTSKPPGASPAALKGGNASGTAPADIALVESGSGGAVGVGVGVGSAAAANAAAVAAAAAAGLPPPARPNTNSYAELISPNLGRRSEREPDVSSQHSLGLSARASGGGGSTTGGNNGNNNASNNNGSTHSGAASAAAASGGGVGLPYVPGTLSIPAPFAHLNDGKSSAGGGRAGMGAGSVGGARGGRGLSAAEVEINRLRAGGVATSLHTRVSLDCSRGLHWVSSIEGVSTYSLLPSRVVTPGCQNVYIEPCFDLQK